MYHADYDLMTFVCGDSGESNTIEVQPDGTVVLNTRLGQVSDSDKEQIARVRAAERDEIAYWKARQD